MLTKAVASKMRIIWTNNDWDSKVAGSSLWTQDFETTTHKGDVGITINFS
jgi:hypothetical protein